MPNVSTLSLIDFSLEEAQFSVQSVPLTAGNFAAQQGLRDTLFTNTGLITLGAESKRQTSVILNVVTPPVTTPEAQRENKWLVTYRDNTPEIVAGTPNNGYGKYFNVEVPTADVTNVLLFQNQSDEADLAFADWITWIASFVAYARSPYGGVPVVTSARFVGRRT